MGRDGLRTVPFATGGYGFALHERRERRDERGTFFVGAAIKGAERVGRRLGTGSTSIRFR
jgi:hypothetical protein